MSFAKYARFVLVYNLIVIIWGVFLRASHSGDGCGQHWLTCGGEVVPSAPELKTVIEYTHRLTTGLAFIAVLILAVWAFRRFKAGEKVRTAAFLALVFILIESLIGAGLVLTGNTADNWTPSRPYWAIGHLINTFLLLAALTLTMWYAAGERSFVRRLDGKTTILLIAAVFAIFVVGSSGSLAALSNMLYPSGSIAQGAASDFAGSSPGLVRLRISHPIVAVISGVFLIFLSGWLRSQATEGRGVRRWSNILSILVLIQLAAGAATILLHAPIVMQLIHLFLADLVWISFVLLCAEFLTQPQRAETSDHSQ